MNYQTFSNLKFRPLLKPSGENIRFVSVAANRNVLIFRKVFNIHLQQKTRYKMVSSGQIEIPYYGIIGRQRGKGFG